MERREHYVYIIFAGHSVYIGRTKNLIERMRGHGMLYGDWAVLEITDGFHVREAEAEWIKQFDDLGCHILNPLKNTNGGCLGWSEEQRAGFRKAHLGKKLSEETRQKMSCAKLARQFGPHPFTPDEAQEVLGKISETHRKGLVPGMETLFTLKEAAAALRIHPETLRRWMGKNDCPTYVRLGRKIFFREVALREFIDKKEVVW